MYVARFNEFDDTGGPFEKELIPKLTVLSRNLSSKLGVEIPDISVSPYFLVLSICWNGIQVLIV